MYLNSRYRPRRRRGIALWRIALWLLAPVLIFVGIGIYQNRATYIPIVNQFVGSVVNQAEGVVATIQAPTPTPTPDPGDRVVRAKASWAQGNYQEAVTLYEDVINALPNDLDAHYFLTLGYLIEGRNIEAVDAAENTITANPFASDAWAIQSMALNRINRYGESIASALRALELNENNARAHAFLAESLFDSGLINRASSEVATALELDPNSFEAYYVRSRIESESSPYDFEAAKEDLRVAYDLSNGMTYIGIALAREELYRDGGDPEAGINLLTEMNEKNPNNPPVLALLGSYYRSQGSREQASTYLNRCVSAVPTAVDCQFWLGRVQYDDEQTELAAESFKKAVDLGSTNPQHYYWAALSQIEAMGNCSAGVEYLKEGYELAKQTGTWISDFEDYMRSTSCGVFDLPTLEPTETPVEGSETEGEIEGTPSA